MPDITKMPIQKITFKENECNYTDESVHGLKEWLIVESLSHLELPDGCELDSLAYFCQQENIDIKNINVQPLEFGLTVNGHKVELGNQIIHSIFNMYQHYYEKIEIVGDVDNVKEYECVRELLNMAKSLCNLASKIDGTVSESVKDAYSDEMQCRRTRINQFIDDIKDK